MICNYFIILSGSAFYKLVQFCVHIDNQFLYLLKNNRKSVKTKISLHRCISGIQTCVVRTRTAICRRQTELFGKTNPTTLMECTF